jgi:glycosyltransferase involved in cell wall biosynthesis
MVKKRILINGSMIDDKPSGVGIYSLYVIKHLLKLQDNNIEFTLITPKNNSVSSFKINKIYISSRLKNSSNRLASFYRLLWNIFVYPFYLRQFDLGYSPTSHGSIFSKNQIVTIHDLIALKYPNQNKLQYYYFKLLLPLWIRKVKKIIAISNITKNDILSTFNCDKKKIQVIYNGFDSRVNKIGSINNLKEKHNFNNFILAIGASYPHKNILTLINSYNCIDSATKAKHKLVICGNKNQHTKFLEEKVFDLGLSQNIIFTGYVSDAELNSLYRHANLFVFPSLYEGFGFPPLEAMRSKCPVIVSDLPIFHEIYSNSVVYFKTNSHLDLSEKIEESLNMKDKNDLVSIGLETASKYTWEKCSAEILNEIKNNIKN